MWDISKNETSTPTGILVLQYALPHFFPIGYHPRKKKKKKRERKKKTFKVTVIPFQVQHKFNYFLIFQNF